MRYDFEAEDNYPAIYRNYLLGIWVGSGTMRLADAAASVVNYFEGLAHQLKVDGLAFDSGTEETLRIWSQLLREPQGALSDDKWLDIIRGKYKALNSVGSVADILEFAELVSDGEVELYDQGPAWYRLTLAVAGGLPGDEVKRLWRFLRILTPAGIKFDAIQGEEDMFRFNTGPGFNEGGLARIIEP